MNPIEQAIENHIARYHKRPRTVFTPPTVKEIDAYCIEKGIAVLPQYIWNHYESKGWKIGKALMKSWRSAVSQARYWENAPCRKLPIKIDPEAEAAALEKRKQEIRDTEGQYFREQTTEKLQKWLADPKSVVRRWLIKEILAEKDKK